MADNFTANPGSGGATFASDENVIGGVTVQVPRIKLGHGADGTYSGDVSTANPLPVQVLPVTANGCTPFRTTSLVATAQSIKGSAGTLYGMMVANLDGATRYIKLYDSASATVGTTQPVMTIPFPGNATDAVAGWIQFPQGIAFANAIQVAATANLADNDTTAPTASKVVFNALYK